VPNPHQGNKVAVVDDDESVRDSTKALLRSAGYWVSTFASAEQFLSGGTIAETDCLILDIWMPGMNGLELQRRLNDSGAGLPIIFLSAHDDPQNRRTATDGGALDFLSKPFEPDRLVAIVHYALSRNRGSRTSA
jgi:FixJ family two-component response regulator